MLTKTGLDLLMKLKSCVWISGTIKKDHYAKHLFEEIFFPAYYMVLI